MFLLLVYGKYLHLNETTRKKSYSETNKTQKKGYCCNRGNNLNKKVDQFNHELYYIEQEQKTNKY